VVLPCRNESASLPGCVASIRSAADSIGLADYEVIVSDSSGDDSARIAAQLGARVVRHEKGYGDALLTGLSAAEGEILVFADCDGSYDFAELPKFIERLQDGGCDMVLGSRFKGSIDDGAMPFMNRYIGNPALTRLFNVRFKTSFSDTHSGFRAISRRAYGRMSLRCRGMEFALEMLAESARIKLKVDEVPIRYGRRRGVSTLRPLHDGLRHLMFILSGGCAGA